MLLKLEMLLLELSATKEIDSGNLTVASKKIMDVCCEGLDISRSSMWKVTDNTLECQLLVDHGERQPTDSLVLIKSHYPIYFRALSKGRVIIANDAHNNKSTFEFSQSYFTPNNINSILDIPIRHKGEMVGIIRCEHQGNQLRKWTPDEVVFGCTLAELYGRALSSAEKVDYEKQLEEINANLEKIVEERTSLLEQKIADLKTTQAQLVESEKMAALGGLVAGIAHEINTPVGVSVTAASHLSDKVQSYKLKYQNDELTCDDFEKLINSATQACQLILGNLYRAGNLIQSFKNIAVDQASDEPRNVRLQEYMQEIIASLSPNLKKLNPDITLECRDTLVAFTHPGALSQIFTNLIMNSLIHGFEKPFDRKATIEIHIVENDELINIQYRDNGHGIQEDKLAKIFNPFFTTKRENGGSGLGMHIVYNLVSQTLGGKIHVTSVVEKGTEFLISFPYQSPKNR